MVGEAMLTMQTDRHKAEIVQEARRVLRVGGRYAIHELAIEPDEVDDEVKTEIRTSLARSIKVNARPLTAAEWRTLFEENGFEVEKIGFAPMALLEPKRILADEGLPGTLKFVRNVLRDSDAAAGCSRCGRRSQSTRSIWSRSRSSPRRRKRDEYTAGRGQAHPYRGARGAQRGRGERATHREARGGHRCTVVRLSFVAGQTMDDHKAGAPILVQAVTGDISFSTADETVSLVPGTAVHVDAGIVHRLVANADSVVQLTILR